MTPNTQITPETVGMLKACPFCGGEADMMAGMGEHWVRCMSCNAGAELFCRPERAAAAWNLRPAASVGEWIGTNTGHGHAWARPDGVRMRCGGPRMCKQCATDAAMVSDRLFATPTPAPSAGDATEKVDWETVGPKLVEAATALVASKQGTFGRGRSLEIDGEKAWIVPSDEMAVLEGALAAATPGGK